VFVKPVNCNVMHEAARLVSLQVGGRWFKPTIHVFSSADNLALLIFAEVAAEVVEMGPR
jgi:hypothetical protein